MKRKLLSILALLCLTVASAWADSFSTTPYSSNVTLSGVTVSSDMTITINSGVTVTVNNGLSISSGKTLTVVGDGTLRVNGAGGSTAVSGNIIVQGATVRAYGGNGSNGSTGSNGSYASTGTNGGTGGNGGNGGAAFSGAVVIYSGQIVAQGGTGGTGGRGGTGGESANYMKPGGTGGTGGRGGNGGTAFTSTLTVYGGNVDAIGGNAGSGGAGGSGGEGMVYNGSSGSSGSSGSNGSAFSNANNLTLINTTDSRMYSNAGHTTEVNTATGKAIYITAPNYIPSLTISEATDNATWISDHAGLVYHITLTRTLQTGGWNTFSVPFSIDNPSGWTVKELTDASYDEDTKTLSLTFGDAASIVAGHAYLVQVESAVENPTFNDVTIVNGTTATTIEDVVEFVPAINPVSMTAYDKTTLFVAGGNSLTFPNTDGYMNGFRAYFHLKGAAAASAASVKSYNMHFGDEDMTGIEKIEDAGLKSEHSNGAIFDLSGRRVQNPTKGIYIKNGRKVVIK